MLTRRFVLFCLAGIIELIFLGLGMGMSVFSLFAALAIIYLAVKILGLNFVNGRVIRMAIGFSLMHICLGNIPIAFAEQAQRLRPISAHFDGKLLSTLSIVFRGPLDHYMYFWFFQSLIFTLIFFGVFVIFRQDNKENG